MPSKTKDVLSDEEILSRRIQAGDFVGAIPVLCRVRGVVARHYDYWRWFCWNVKMYKAPTYQQIYAKMVEGHYVCEEDAIVSIRNLQQLKKEWEKPECASNAHQWVMEDMCNTFTDVRMATARSISPDTAAKFHIDPYPDEWKVTYEFVGRSGGWLSLEMFEGITMRHMTMDPQHTIVDMENDYAQKLCAMIEEISVIVSHRDNEYLYHMSEQLQFLAEGEG
jgi:hypothetical protein